MNFIKQFTQHNIQIGKTNCGYIHVPKIASTTIKSMMLQAAGYDYKYWWNKDVVPWEFK
jgi:hypothetical protein